MHEIDYRENVIAMLTARICAHFFFTDAPFVLHSRKFLLSVAAAVLFVWQPSPWQRGGGRQVGDVHSFQARRFGSLEVLVLDSKRASCAPFPKRR